MFGQRFWPVFALNAILPGWIAGEPFRFFLLSTAAGTTPIAGIASRLNTLLSLPMFYCMVNANLT